MNKKILIVAVALLVILGGYIFLKGSSSPQTGVPRNPEGVVNEEVEGSNYRLFSPAEYKKAKEEKKVIMLYFTANWCPTCREQEPVNMEALTELSSDSDIIAFRVHILDSETTKDGEALADEFAVRYQHTTVILDSEGKIASTFTGPITAPDLKSRLLEAKKS